MISSGSLCALQNVTMGSGIPLGHKLFLLLQCHVDYFTICFGIGNNSQVLCKANTVLLTYLVYIIVSARILAKLQWLT